jgi:pyrroline-5-carboxylate reductase
MWSLNPKCRQLPRERLTVRTVDLSSTAGARNRWESGKHGHPSEFSESNGSPCRYQRYLVSVPTTDQYTMVQASVIGCGNMGGALVKGLSRTGNHTVVAYDVDPEALDAISEYCSATTMDIDVATEPEIVFVAVKPNLVGDVVAELELDPEQTLITIAAGVPTAMLEARTDATVVRVMPNLAAESGTMAAAVAGAEVTDDVESLLEDVGIFVEIDEAQMDVATAVNGSGPAFVFYLLNAVQQAGVNSGLSPEDARILAAQTFKGAAETVLRSDDSIDELIDAVCSPKGTTIAGMEVLRDSSVEETIGGAVTAAENRSKELAPDYDDE